MANFGSPQKNATACVPDPDRRFGADRSRNLRAQNSEGEVRRHRVDEALDAVRVDDRVVVEDPGIARFMGQGPAKTQVCAATVTYVLGRSDDDDAIANLR